MTIHTTQLNNLPYRYSIYKKNNSKEYCVFLLGALQQIENVEYFSQYFSQYINTITIELPGTGINPPLTSRYCIKDQAYMLFDLLQFLKIDSIHLAVFSYATAIAIEAYKIHPDVRSISIAGGSDGIPEAGRKNTILMLSDSLRNPKQFASVFIDSLTVDDKNIPRGKAIVRQIKNKVSQFNENQLVSFCENTLRLLGFKPSYDLSEIKIPCAICVGEKDPYVTLENALELSKKIPNCSFDIIKNADHLIHLEYPEETAKLLSKPILQLHKTINIDSKVA